MAPSNTWPGGRCPDVSAGIAWWNSGEQLSQLTGMTLDGEPDIREYPTPADLGGHGVQIYFPWVESWLIIGTWPDLNLIRVAMSTCAVERFLPVMVTKFLEAAVGTVIKYGFAEW